MRVFGGGVEIASETILSWQEAGEAAVWKEEGL